MERNQKNLRDGLTAEYQDRGPLELSREVLRARGRFPLYVRGADAVLLERHERPSDLTGPPASLRPPLAFARDVVALYQAMDEMGLNYGPSFQAIETLHCGDPEHEAGAPARPSS